MEKLDGLMTFLTLPSAYFAIKPHRDLRPDVAQATQRFTTPNYSTKLISNKIIHTNMYLYRNIDY